MLRCRLSLVVSILLTTSSLADDAVRARQIIQQLSELAAVGGSSFIASDLSATNITAIADNDRDTEFMSRWLSQNSDSIIGVKRSPFPSNQSFGTATQKGNKLYLHVRQLTDDHTLQIPRLHNSVLRVSTLGGPQPTGRMSNLTPGVNEWVIELPKETVADDLPVVVLDLDSPPRVAVDEVPVVQQQSDTIVLHSRDGMPHGKMLRFEPQPHKNTIGYWIHESDWVEWKLHPSETKEFQVVLRYGCGANQGGSEISLSFSQDGSDERTVIPYTVEATGGFQDWRDVTVGNVKLTKDRVVGLTVKPIHKAKAAVMDIQQITLISK
jgi:hypothetical protein